MLGRRRERVPAASKPPSRGRTGLYEVMLISEEIRSLTLQRASADQITAVAVREGMRRLREDGLDKVKSGQTSMAEVARVTGVA